MTDATINSRKEWLSGLKDGDHVAVIIPPYITQKMRHSVNAVVTKRTKTRLTVLVNDSFKMVFRVDDGELYTKTTPGSPTYNACIYASVQDYKDSQ